MKGQLLCLMLVAFVVTLNGMLFDCTDRKNCDKCPPVVKKCKYVRKCGCCQICLDALKKGESCVRKFASLRECGRGLRCDRKSLTCQPETCFIPRMFMKSYYAALTRTLDTNKYVKCSKGLCYCVFEGKRVKGYKIFERRYAGHFVCYCAVENIRNEHIGKAKKQCTSEGAYRLF